MSNSRLIKLSSKTPSFDGESFIKTLVIRFKISFTCLRENYFRHLSANLHFSFRIYPSYRQHSFLPLSFRKFYFFFLLAHETFSDLTQKIIVLSGAYMKSFCADCLQFCNFVKLFLLLIVFFKLRYLLRWPLIIFMIPVWRSCLELKRYL